MIFRSATSRWLLGMFFVAALACTTARAADFHYSYFKERIDLTLEPETFAVRLGSGLDQQGFVERLIGARLAVDEPVAGPGPGWLTYRVTRPGSSTADAAAVLARIRDVGRPEYVTPVFRTPNGGTYVPTDSILVRFASGGPDQADLDALAAVGATTAVDDDGVVTIQSGARDGLRALQIANVLAVRSSVEFAEPDAFLTGIRSYVSNDPLSQFQWALENDGSTGGTAGIDMNALAAWAVTKGAPSIRIGILDDGVDLQHEDLNVATTLAKDFTGSGTGGGPGNACDNHGTMVAGCIAGRINNGKGIAGIAPICQVVPLRIAEATQQTSPCEPKITLKTSWLTAALDYCADAQIQITNSSFSTTPSSSLASKYQTTRDKGVLHFGSSGNDGTPYVVFPASLPAVVAVGAVTHAGTKASFSQYGFDLSVTAPGELLWTTDRMGAAGEDPQSNYVQTQGTSFSSPYAAGVAALILSVNPGLSPDQTQAILESSARDLGKTGWDSSFGHGLTDAGAAVDAAGADIFHADAMIQPTYPAEPSGNYGYFGYDIAADGDDVLVSAPNYNPPLSASGMVSAYTRESGEWIHVQNITEADLPIGVGGQYPDMLLTQIAASDGLATIFDLRKTLLTYYPQLHVYQRTSVKWVYDQSIDLREMNYVQYSKYLIRILDCAMDGNTIAVTVRHIAESPPLDQRSLQIYERALGTNTWTRVFDDVPLNEILADMT